MIRSIVRVAFVSLAFFAFSILAIAPRAGAGIIPLRSGTVISKVDAGIITYIKAVDGAGKEFWVMTSVCTVGEAGKIEVLAGTHYDKIKSDHLNTVLEDVYTAQLLKIGDLEVNGFSAHGIPDGCIALQ